MYNTYDMVKIRLQRTGRKNQPMYRIVAADSRARRDGKHLDILGWYKPTGEKEGKLDVEKYQDWISKGAQPSERVKKIADQLS